MTRFYGVLEIILKDPLVVHIKKPRRDASDNIQWLRPLAAPGENPALVLSTDVRRLTTTLWLTLQGIQTPRPLWLFTHNVAHTEGHTYM